MRIQKIWQWLEEPVHFRKINGWLTILWFIAAFPICIFLAKSLPFLVFVSVYAVVTGHLATWQAARVEVEQTRQAENMQDQEEADMRVIQRKVEELHRKLLD